jgi:putative flippase GtrA
MSLQSINIDELDDQLDLVHENKESIKNHKVGFFASLYKQMFSSMSATSVDFIITIFFNRILGFHYLQANIIGGICGATANFFIGRKWVYKKINDKMRYQIIRFMIIHMTALAINSTFIYIIKESSGMNFELTKILVASLVGFSFNFLMGRYFVFYTWRKRLQ